MSDFSVQYANQLHDFDIAFEPEPLTEAELATFYYDGTFAIRMGDEYNETPIDAIYNACRRPRPENAHLLLGHRGCGKSTELVRLKTQLEAEGRQVIVINATLQADRSSLIYNDLLILLGKELIELAQRMKYSFDETLAEDILSFWDTLEIMENFHSSEKAKAKVGLGAWVASVGADIQAGGERREIIRKHVTRNTGQWLGYIRELSQHLTAHMGHQPIVIFEELDKLTTDSAWSVFSNALTKLPFPVIYTFPISLSFDPRFADIRSLFNDNVHILPMIKVRTKEGEPYELGVDSIVAIVEKRCDPSLFEEEVLEFLVKKTGGVLRHLFLCIKWAASRASRRKSQTISYEDALEAAKRQAALLIRTLEVNDFETLVEISRGSKEKSQIHDRQTLLRMVQGLIVLEYNATFWHDLHPLIEDYLIEQGRIPKKDGSNSEDSSHETK